jgi:hypothetical protein
LSLSNDPQPSDKPRFSGRRISISRRNTCHLPARTCGGGQPCDSVLTFNGAVPSNQLAAHLLAFGSAAYCLLSRLVKARYSLYQPRAHWVHGIARLESHCVPRDVPAHRWRQVITDCHTFFLAKENWAERAAGHGWNDVELFGCCRRPLERLGNAGLLWAINGGRLVELHRDWAVIERASDRSRHVHQRERPKAADITLPWIGLR